MKSRPVPGWRIDLHALLPGSVTPNANRLVGRVGTTAYFIVADFGATSGPSRTWLLGIDVTRGVPTFPAVELPGDPNIDCYLNGPNRVLCLQLVREPDPNNPGNDLWIVDTTSGNVLHHAPTDLGIPHPGRRFLEVQQVGGYAVAVENSAAVYGLDDHGQTTWSVTAPNMLLSDIRAADLPGDAPSNVAVLSSKDGMQALDVTTGKILLHSKTRLVPVLGGYVTEDSDHGDKVFGFYDERGAEIGRYQLPKRTSGGLTGAGQLPMLDVNPTETSMILDRFGVPMAVIETPSLQNSRIVGKSVFVSNDRDKLQATNWAKYDLRTGERASSCPRIPLTQDNFFGSDGTVVVGSFDDPTRQAPRTLVGVDSDNCKTLWEIANVWKAWTIGATLVQSVVDSNELISLTPPA